MFQVYQAKISDIKPAVPSHFPSDLKELVLQSFSKEPKKRPPIEDINSALEIMLKGEETEQNPSTTLPEISFLNEEDEQVEGKLAFYKNSEEKENNSTKQFCTNLSAGSHI